MSGQVGTRSMAWMRRHKVATGFLVLFAVGAVGSAFEEPKPQTATMSAVPGSPDAPDYTRTPVVTSTPTAVPTPTSTPVPAVTPVPTPSPVPTPVVESRTVVVAEAVPFARKTVQDGSLARGREVVTTKGVAGRKQLTYEVTFTDGVETARTLVDETVDVRPVTQITSIGTKVAAKPKPAPKPASNCDSNYAGGCVPIASDVDCAGGSGNGPAYVAGPVRVVGNDIYGLDADNDGLGCE